MAGTSKLDANRASQDSNAEKKTKSIQKLHKSCAAWRGHTLQDSRENWASQTIDMLTCHQSPHQSCAAQTSLYKIVQICKRFIKYDTTSQQHVECHDMKASDSSRTSCQPLGIISKLLFPKKSMCQDHALVKYGIVESNLSILIRFIVLDINVRVWAWYCGPSDRLSTPVLYSFTMHSKININLIWDVTNKTE